MAKKNNVDLGALEKMAANIQSDAAKGKRTNRIEGVWNLAEGQPQFTAEASFEGGKLALEADQPTFLGGGGTRPGPMLYCLYGVASCFTATFASVAAMEGVELAEVRTTAECDLDFAQVFGVADRPTVQEVRVSLTVRSQAPRHKIKEVLRLAEERCPAAYVLAHPVLLVARVATA